MFLNQSPANCVSLHSGCSEVLDNKVWLVSLGFDVVLTCSFVSRIHNIFNNFIHISIHTITPVLHAFSACCVAEIFLG